MTYDTGFYITHITHIISHRTRGTVTHKNRVYDTRPPTIEVSNMRQFEKKLLATHAAHDAVAQVKPTNWKACDAAHLAHRAAIDEAAEHFAAERGWKVSARFTVSELLGRKAMYCQHPANQIIDHAIYFKQRVPVAILTMPYHLPEDLAFEGLQVEVLDQMSWHYPGRTLMALITAPDRFLPDHLRGARVTNLARNVGGAT